MTSSARLAVFLPVALLLGACGPTEDDIRRVVGKELAAADSGGALRSVVREELAAAARRSTVAPVEAIGPYSPAVRVGGFLFVSGQIALDPATGRLVQHDVAAETRQVLENINRILRAAGYDSSHVVSATVYLRDMTQYAAMNLVYGGYFQEGAYPARVTVEVSALPRGANVEIAVVAAKPL